ncbi:MAG TPA: hypothetical protein VFY24_05175, partial [Azospira sp.]|nr:hypothetical protein [Azospira sp.]
MNPNTKPLQRSPAVTAALALLLAGCLAAAPVAAHEGHQHADEKPLPTTRGDGPQRLADGSVFLPKLTQRQLELRTQLTETG